MVKKKYLSVILAILLSVLVLWTIWGNVTVGVTHYSVTSKQLPDSFDGFKIAVVSDLHNARFGRDNSQIVRKIEEEHPDIIAITGDLVDANRTDMETAIALVHKLIQLAGLDDPDFTERDTVVQQSLLQTKLNQMNLYEEYCILLSHRPETFEAYVEENIDLVLSGHAHGGHF